MILTTISQSLTAVLSGAKSTNDCPITGAYQQISGNGTVVGYGGIATITNGVTAVPFMTEVGLATGGLAGNVNPYRLTNLQIYNADTASVTVTITLADSAGTNRVLYTVALAVGDALMYSLETGFYVLTSSGARKSTQTSGSANQLKVVIPIATGLLASLANTSTYRVAVPFAFTVLSARFVADVPATTGSKLATLTLSTTAGAVTGGVMALTSANMTPTGAAVAATAISGANASGTAAQEVILTVSAVTAFVEGSGHAEIVVSNNS